MYKVVYPSQARKDAKKANASGLKDNILKIVVYSFKEFVN